MKIAGEFLANSLGFCSDFSSVRSFIGFSLLDVRLIICDVLMRSVTKEIKRPNKIVRVAPRNEYQM